MSQKRARYVGGSQTGVTVAVTLDSGDIHHLHIQPGGELPAEINGSKIPAAFRDSLLEQSDNWTEVNRATGDDTKAKTTTTAQADEKEGDR